MVHASCSTCFPVIPYLLLRNRPGAIIRGNRGPPSTPTCFEAVTIFCCILSNVGNDRRLLRFILTKSECVSQPHNSNCCSRSKGKSGISKVAVSGPNCFNFMQTSRASCTRWYCQTRLLWRPVGSSTGKTLASKSCPCSPTRGVQKNFSPRLICAQLSSKSQTRTSAAAGI